MSELYTLTLLFVARSYHHGGHGLEDQGLRFFRSREEYEREAKEKNGNRGRSFKTSWCTEPAIVQALVRPEDLERFMAGHPLTADQVFFRGTQISAIHRIGGWQN